jgi:hypothetical protein
MAAVTAAAADWRAEGCEIVLVCGCGVGVYVRVCECERVGAAMAARRAATVEAQQLKAQHDTPDGT